MTGQPDKFSKLLEVISSQIEKDFADDESDGSIDWKAVSKSMGAANWSPKQCESLWLAHAYATAHDANAEPLSSKQRKRSREDGQSDEESSYDLTHGHLSSPVIKKPRSGRSNPSDPSSKSQSSDVGVLVKDPVQFNLPRHYALMVLPAFRDPSLIGRRRKRPAATAQVAEKNIDSDEDPALLSWADRRRLSATFSAACSHSDHANTIARTTKVTYVQKSAKAKK